MADDERPAKMRKLSHGGDEADTDAQDLQEENGASHHTEEDQSSDIANGNAADQVNDLEPNGDVEDAVGNDQENIGEASTLPPPDTITQLPASAPTLGPDGQPMSKNQQKKLKKKQEWEAKREDRRIIRKEKTLAKRERKREARREQQASEEPPPPRRPKGAPTQKPVTLPVTFLIDCDFDDLMRDNERISLAAQITRCYSDNRNAMFKANLAVCSFNGILRERFDNVLSHHKNWKGIRFLDEDFVAAAEKAKEWTSPVGQPALKVEGSAFAHLGSLDAVQQAELQNEGEVVYLTSESEYTLTELKPYSTYIIGGLVDKNREKGICYKRARARGVKTARLPIGDYLEMTSRKVLATNHVNEIMLKWLELGDWGEAFMKVIPKRKGGKLKGQEGDGEDGDGVEDGAEGGAAHEEEDGAVVNANGDPNVQAIAAPALGVNGDTERSA